MGQKLLKGLEIVMVCHQLNNSTHNLVLAMYLATCIFGKLKAIIKLYTKMKDFATTPTHLINSKISSSKHHLCFLMFTCDVTPHSLEIMIDSSKKCLIKFILDPNQTRQNVGPYLDPNCLTL